MFIGYNHKQLFAPYVIMAFAITAALTFSCVVGAVGIGEVVSQSKLGEPLLVQVDLMVGVGEHIDDSCLSLSSPSSLDEDTSGYLTKANLTLKTEEKRQYVVISSRNPFNDAFARLRLQVNCAGTGSVVKTLTILPDLDISVPQTPIAAPSAPAEAVNISAPAPSGAHDIASASKPRNTHDKQPEVAILPSDKPVRLSHKRQSPVRTTNRKHNNSPSYRLELSGEPIDESRIGKVGAEGRALLLARQKMLDADEQMIKFLAMQRQVKLLQDELREVKSQLAQLGVKPSAAVTPAMAPPAPPMTTEGTPGVRPEAASAASQTTTLANTAQSASAVKRTKPATPKVVAPQPSLLDEILGEPLYMAGGAAALLGLGGIGFMLARRRNGGIAGNADTRIAEPIMPSPDTGDFTYIAAAPTISLAEPDNINPISEADLFLNFGRDVQAEEILQDALNINSDNQQIRLKLLSIYANRKDTKTFFDVARQVKNSGDASAWAQAAEMGRKLEPGNQMYGGNDNAAATSDTLSSEEETVNIRASMLFGAKEAGSVALDMPLDATSTTPSGLDFDLSIITQAKADPALVEHESPAAPKKPPVEQTDTLSVLDFDLGLDVPTETPASAKTNFDSTIKLKVPEFFQTEEQAPGLGNLDFDMSATPLSPAVMPEKIETAETPSKNVDVMALMLDFPHAEELSADKAVPATAKEVDIIDLSELMLNLDTPSPAHAPAEEVIESTKNPVK